FPIKPWFSHAFLTPRSTVQCVYEKIHAQTLSRRLSGSEYRPGSSSHGVLGCGWRWCWHLRRVGPVGYNELVLGHGCLWRHVLGLAKHNRRYRHLHWLRVIHDD